MQAFVRETGVLAPLDRVDVDTDQIIPKQFLKRVERTGFGQFCFYDWRFREDGSLNPDFELNNPAYRGAPVLVSGRNFGCGSSREHAPWALQDMGFKAVIAPSFADIFFNNCFKNGVLPVVLPEATVNELLARAKERPGYRVTVDLERQVVEDEEGVVAPFEVDPFRRHLMLNGLDDIGLTLQHADAITAFEQRMPGRLRGLTTARRLMATLDRFSLAGKVALVTGASHGIGEGIAIGFAEAGADVALAARSVDDLERVAGLVRDRGRRAIVLPTDVAMLDQVEAMVPATLERLGRLDAFVNVAGNQRRRPILEVTREDWDFIMDVQLRAAFFGAQAAGRHFCQQGAGKVVHIASMTSYRGFLDIALYGIAKTGVVGMTRYMAIEWAPHNVQVNAIAPGWIETPMTATMQPGRRQWVEDHVPQHSYGQPRDIADLAVYLASPAADYVTGQTFPVDGGFLAGNPWPRLDAPPV